MNIAIVAVLLRSFLGVDDDLLENIQDLDCSELILDYVQDEAEQQGETEIVDLCKWITEKKL